MFIVGGDKWTKCCKWIYLCLRRTIKHLSLNNSDAGKHGSWWAPMEHWWASRHVWWWLMMGLDPIVLLNGHGDMLDKGGWKWYMMLNGLYSDGSHACCTCWEEKVASFRNGWRRQPNLEFCWLKLFPGKRLETVHEGTVSLLRVASRAFFRDNAERARFTQGCHHWCHHWGIWAMCMGKMTHQRHGTNSSMVLFSPLPYMVDQGRRVLWSLGLTTS